MANSKLKQYSLIAAAVVTGSTAQAEIIITDVDPDSTISPNAQPYFIDMNNDDENDYGFNNIGVISAIAGIGGGYYNYMAVLDSGWNQFFLT